jgi:hypothetical protein
VVATTCYDGKVANTVGAEDPFYVNVWHLKNTGPTQVVSAASNKGMAGINTNVEAVHKGVTIAIVDSALELGHENLKDNLAYSTPAGRRAAELKATEARSMNAPINLAMSALALALASPQTGQITCYETGQLICSLQWCFPHCLSPLTKSNMEFRYCFVFALLS